MLKKRIQVIYYHMVNMSLCALLGFLNLNSTKRKTIVKSKIPCNIKSKKENINIVKLYMNS